MTGQNLRRIFVILAIFAGLFLIGSLTFFWANVPATQEQGPVKVIFETDFTFDVDDVGALAILHAMADNGEAEILAISYNEAQENAAQALDAINTWYGRGDIPIGLYDKSLELPDYNHSWYIDELAGVAHDINDNTVDTSLNMYKQVLAQQPDNSVTIISVGFLNNLYDLLQDDPDLVARKVNKLVLMGGVKNDEFNFVRHNLVSQSQYVIENWPGLVVISQEGVNILTGSALKETPAGNPVREAYYKWFFDSFEDRASWDQVAVLYGVRGPNIYFDEVSSGTGRLLNGYAWHMQPGYRTYLTHRLSNSQMAPIIEELMIQAPGSYKFSKPGAVAGLRPSHLSGRGQETGPSAILTGSLNLYPGSAPTPTSGD